MDFEIGQQVRVIATGKIGKVVAKQGNAFYAIQFASSVKWYQFNKIEHCVEGFPL